MAVRAEYSDAILDANGNAISGASIEIRQVGGTTKITESIYADASGATTLTNPLTADSSGRFQFYLAQSKRVDLYVSATGYTAYTVEDVDVAPAAPFTVYKTADETVNNSDTLQADDALLFTVGPSEVWLFDLNIFFISGTTPDIKFGWTYPSGTLITWKVVSGAAAATLAQTDTSVQNGTGGTVGCEYTGVVMVSTTAGTVNLTWAQNTANASDTKVKASSWMVLHRAV